MALESDVHIPANAAAGSWLGAKRSLSQRQAGCLLCDRTEGPAPELQVLVLLMPPFLLVGQSYAWKF